MSPIFVDLFAFLALVGLIVLQAFAQVLFGGL
jgi:hypothetical protein